MRGIGKRMVRTGEEKIGELVERGRDIGSAGMRNIKEARRGARSEIILAVSRGEKRERAKLKENSSACRKKCTDLPLDFDKRDINSRLSVE